MQTDDQTFVPVCQPHLRGIGRTRVLNAGHRIAGYVRQVLWAAESRVAEVFRGRPQIVQSVNQQQRCCNGSDAVLVVGVPHYDYAGWNCETKLLYSSSFRFYSRVFTNQLKEYGV